MELFMCNHPRTSHKQFLAKYFAVVESGLKAQQLANFSFGKTKQVSFSFYYTYIVVTYFDEIRCILSLVPF